jgi:starch synthase (maltosyl-transferring)
LLCYAKHTADQSNIVIVAVNLDPRYAQSGWVDVPIGEYALAADEPYELHDLLTDTRYVWRGAHNYIALDPTRQPAHLLQVRRLKSRSPMTA